MNIDPNDVIYAALAFFILPPLVSFLTAVRASGAVKSLVLSVLAIVAGISVTLLQGDFNTANVSKTILIIIVSAAGSYKLILRDFANTFGPGGLQIGKPTTPPAPTESPIPVTIVDKDSLQT